MSKEKTDYSHILNTNVAKLGGDRAGGDGRRGRKIRSLSPFPQNASPQKVATFLPINLVSPSPSKLSFDFFLIRKPQTVDCAALHASRKPQRDRESKIKFPPSPRDDSVGRVAFRDAGS